MAISDLWKKGESLFSTTLSAGISTGTGETITLESVSGLPTDTEITLTFDRVDANGTETPTKMERITGTISGSTLTSYTRGTDGSTEQAHSAGAVIEYIFNSQDLNDMVDGFLAEHSQAGAHTVDTISEKTAAAGVTVDGIKLKDGNSIANTGTADHIAITPGTSKLVKIAVLRQDDTTNTYSNTQVILTGWGFKTGHAANSYIAEAVTFGITFDSRPIVVSNGLGVKSNSDPSHIGDFTSSGGNFALCVNPAAISTTGFTADMRRVDGLATAEANRWGYSWICIGTLA